MYPRTEYEMTEEDEKSLLESCKPVPAMMIGGVMPPTPQENANRAWAALGKKMGFDYMTVRPIQGKGNRFFTAVPSETQEARDERLAREAEEKRQRDIDQLTEEIAERKQRLDALKGNADG
jgi:hypothetical protein